MTNIIALLSQKGGVGKSTLARAIATEAFKSGQKVKLADLDIQQGTSTEWHRQRLESGHDPIGSVEIFNKASTALKSANEFDFLVIDGTPRASSGTLDVAKNADLVILPCCASRDDLIPAVKLAHELVKKGTSRNKIVFALVRVTTESEIFFAREFLEESSFTVLEGCLYEKPAYRQAQNEGLAVTETRYKTLNSKANVLLESVINQLMDK